MKLWGTILVPVKDIFPLPIAGGDYSCGGSGSFGWYSGILVSSAICSIALSIISSALLFPSFLKENSILQIYLF